MCQTDQNSGSWQSPCCGSFCHKSNMGSCSDRNTGFLWNKGATSCPVWNGRSSRIWEFQGQTWKVLGKPGRLSWPHYSVINNRHFFSGPHLDPKPKWGDGRQGRQGRQEMTPVKYISLWYYWKRSLSLSPGKYASLKVRGLFSISASASNLLWDLGQVALSSWPSLPPSIKWGMWIWSF